MRIVRLSIFSILMIATAGLLFVVSRTPLFSFTPFDSRTVNWMLNYQLSALPVAGVALLLTYVFAGRVRLRYLSTKRTGPMSLFGQPGRARWESDAWFLVFSMVAIVGIATFFQLLPTGFTFHWAYVALIVPFAAMNAFTEEAIFRLPYVTMGDNDTRSPFYGLVMGSLVFGVFHYWGVAPNGFIGAIMSAFLGYVLAKSILQTKGFFWALTIHFMLNLAGMLFVLNRTP